MAERISKSFIRSRLKTRQLALLVHLDDERCVVRAAEAVGMTQPAASKFLRDIEAALQVRLFERHARGVAPTWYGEILVRRARLVLSEIGRAQDEIAALKAGLSGQAAVGAVLSPGTNLVPRAVARVKERYPSMLISLELDYSKPLVDKLLQGHFDMVIARITDSRGADELNYEPLADEPHAVIAGVQHPLAGVPDLTLEKLCDQVWILPSPGSLLRDRLAESFLRRGIAVPRNIVQTSSLAAIIPLLQTTNMVVPLPEEAVRPYVEAGLLTVLVKQLGVEIDAFGLITRRNHKLSPGAEVMIAALKEAAAEIYPAA